MSTATIKMFLPYGDATRLRIVEVSNWSGKALAAPRTDLQTFLGRDETGGSGIYFLLGTDPNEGNGVAYIGEAEIIRDRAKQHKNEDYWNAIIAFISKDENLTKAHIRYLESRITNIAKEIDRYRVINNCFNNPKLPESDREDMEVFLEKIRLVIPVLGCDILTPISDSQKPTSVDSLLYCQVKNVKASGARSSTGFIVFAGSTAALQDRPAAIKNHPYVVNYRQKCVKDGVLIEKDGLYHFTKDVEFQSPSLAGSVVSGGGVNGLIVWKNSKGQTLKEIEGA